MKKLLYSLAIIIVITLVFGYFGHPASSPLQVLLFVAAIAVISTFIFTEKSKKEN